MPDSKDDCFLGQTVFVCHGTPERHVEVLNALAETGDIDSWTINRHARKGDRVLFYLKAPLSAFVAVATVLADALEPTRQGENWGATHWMADVGEVRMLREPLRRLALLDLMPAWGFLKQPRASVQVPDEYLRVIDGLIKAGGLLSLAEETVAEDPSADSVEPTIVAPSDEDAVAEASAVDDVEVSPVAPYDEETLEAVGQEGRRFLRVHWGLERDRKIVRSKKAIVRSSTGKLECEVCGVDAASFFGQEIAEVHHARQLAAQGGQVETRLEDLCILCPNCHRTIHKLQPMPTPAELRARVRE